MKKQIAIVYGPLLLAIGVAMVMPIWSDQQFIRFAPAEGANTAFAKVESNFFQIWPKSFATGESYTLSPNYMFHSWTGVAVRATNYLPLCSVGSRTNVVRIIFVDEGLNAANTNLILRSQPGDTINGSTQYSISLGGNFLRVYSVGGNTWHFW